MIRKRKTDSKVIGIARNDDEGEALREALSYIPVNEIIDSASRITITANLVNMNSPEDGVTVGYKTLERLIELLKKQNPKSITLAAGSGGAETKDVLERYGCGEVLRKEDVDFVDLNYGDFRELNLGGKVVKSTKINTLIDRTDVLISFTQLKIHEEACMSASIKNMALSWPPAQQHGHPKKDLGIHNDLHDFIYHMGMEIPIDMAVVSLNPAMVGTGPSNGVPIKSGVVICGGDAVAVDTVCARILGFRPQAIHYLYKLINSGVGESDVSKMDIKGMKLVDIEKLFSKMVYGKEFAIDKN